MRSQWNLRTDEKGISLIGSLLKSLRLNMQFSCLHCVLLLVESNFSIGMEFCHLKLPTRHQNQYQWYWSWLQAPCQCCCFKDCNSVWLLSTRCASFSSQDKTPRFFNGGNVLIKKNNHFSLVVWPMRAIRMEVTSLRWHIFLFAIRLGKGFMTLTISRNIMPECYALMDSDDEEMYVGSKQWQQAVFGSWWHSKIDSELWVGPSDWLRLLGKIHLLSNWQLWLRVASSFSVPPISMEYPGLLLETISTKEALPLQAIEVVCKDPNAIHATWGVFLIWKWHSPGRTEIQAKPQIQAYMSASIISAE